MKISCQVSWGVVLSSPRLFSTYTYCLHWNAVQRSTFSVLTRATNGTAIILLAALSPTVSHVGMWYARLCVDTNWIKLRQQTTWHPQHYPLPNASTLSFFHITGLGSSWIEKIDELGSPTNSYGTCTWVPKTSKKNQSASSHACRKLEVGILNRTEPMVNTILRHANLKSVYPAHPFLAYAQHLSLEGLLLQREAPERSIACWRFKSQYVSCCQSMCEYPYHFPKHLHVCVWNCVFVYLSTNLSTYLSTPSEPPSIVSDGTSGGGQGYVLEPGRTFLYIGWFCICIQYMIVEITSLGSFHQQRTSMRFSF